MTEADLKRHFGEILNVMHEGLFVVSPKGRILLANKAMERLTGYTQREMTGRPCAIFHCDACERQRQAGGGAWCLLFADKLAESKRCHIRRRDGTLAPVQKNQVLLYDANEVLCAVETVIDLTEADRLGNEVGRLSRMLSGDRGFFGMIGQSAPMREAFELIEKAAQSDAPVLLCGESGTGKELAARAIHELGRRSRGPFVTLNCAALSESLLESELFGHVKGAFTGAHRHRRGRFELANGGDIFLDEIGDAPASIQVKLLRVLESKTFERVGENTPMRADARLISATNKDLRQLVREGKFREDFLFRINVIPVTLPPLRKRREDIPLLCDHILARIAESRGKPAHRIAPDTLRLFMEHPWPGNVRELQSVLEYACVVATGESIALRHLPGQMLAGGVLHPAAAGEEPAGPMDERAELVEALRRAGGNKSQAARILGVSRLTVHNRMIKYAVTAHRTVSD